MNSDAPESIVSEILPWKNIKSEQIADCRVFTVHKKTFE